ncbi:MAG: hypothetical protein IKR77_08615 [Bacteroidales bacterium]|nr:hypothetical protein [Bacteroidales bacterium]
MEYPIIVDDQLEARAGFLWPPSLLSTEWYEKLENVRKMASRYARMDVLNEDDGCAREASFFFMDTISIFFLVVASVFLLLLLSFKWIIKIYKS